MFGTLQALAALLGNTAATAYGGATVYGIYEYKSGDKEKGEEDLKKVALSAITMAGAFGAQGNVNVTNTPGGNVQPNGSLALEGGRIIGYSIALEGVTSISSEVTDALDITQSAIANGGGSSGTNEEKTKSHLSNQQANKIKKEILEGKDVKFKTKEEALEFIERMFPEFKQEVAGERSSEGWHFDSHPINDSTTNIDHINIYSKKQGFRVHITWGD